MQLHKNKEEFKQIVQAVADDYGLGNFQVEKDYYVSLFLKELQKIESNIQIVFKGGTSLSKCYDVIDRFSEDIDLAVKFNTEKITNGERRILKKNIIEIIKSLGMGLLNPDEVRSRRDHNEYNVEYNNIFKPDENTVPYIIVETIVVYRPYPIKELGISNYITKYLLRNSRPDLVELYELTPFTMPIQTIERTFVDKLFAICDYHLQKKYFRYSRHIYDIHKIWTSNLMDKKIMTSIIDEVVKDRQLFGTQNVSCQPGMNPQEVLEDIVSSNSFKEDYNAVTSTFIHIPVEYGVCMNTVRAISDINILPNKIKEY